VYFDIISSTIDCFASKVLYNNYSSSNLYDSIYTVSTSGLTGFYIDIGHFVNVNAAYSYSSSGLINTTGFA